MSVAITEYIHKKYKFFPLDVRKTLPPLYATDNQGEEAIVRVKFFSPVSNWNWYATEFDGEDTFFGLVAGFEIELGYFSLSELENVRLPHGLRIERDMYFKPKTLAEIRQYENSLRR